VPKAYFGYEPTEARCRYEPMVVVDRFKAYSFLGSSENFVGMGSHFSRSKPLFGRGAEGVLNEKNALVLGV
jgi:hypothetical protein